MGANENIKKFDKAVLEGKATWWQMELPSGEVIFGDAKPKMLGYLPDEFKKYQDFTSLIHPDDYEKAMQAMRDCLTGKAKVYETDYRIKNVDGEYVKFFDYGEIVKRDGDKIRLIGLVMKVNETGDIENQAETFKKLVTTGGVSVLELFGKAGGQQSA